MGWVNSYWEGPKGVKDLAAICNTFNLGIAMHSGAEFGIELAAILHTASTIPAMSFASNAHYHYLTYDIIEGGLVQYKNGCIAVSAGPGLGVTLDEDKMKHYEKTMMKKMIIMQGFTRIQNAPIGIRLLEIYK